MTIKRLCYIVVTTNFYNKKLRYSKFKSNDTFKCQLSTKSNNIFKNIN